jgi:ACS family hexuronate transporter-like MFS transporter
MRVQAEGAPDRYRWVILGVLWITYIVVFLNRLSVGPLAPFFKEDLGITSTQVGLVMSAAGFGYMLSIFPIGWVVDRIGARWPIVAGELIAGTCMIALFFAPSYMWLLILMFVTGLGCGFLLPSTTQGVVAWFPLRERATVMGLKQTAVNIGGIISAATLPAVALALGWRFCFLFLGLIAIAIGGAAYFFYRDPRPGSSTSMDSETPDAAVPLLEILKSRDIWLIALCGLCLAWVEMAVIAHLVLYLTEVLLFGVVAAGGMLAMTEAAGAIARPGSGFLSDRIFGGKRKPVFMLMAGAASAMCFITGLFGADLSWGLYLVLFILGVSGVAFGGIFLTLMSEFGGRRGAGKAVGLGGILTLAGVTLGPTFFGYIVDTFSSYRLAWLSLGFIAMICVLLLFPVREGKRKI